MEPHLEPLLPGQAFSFVEPVYTKLWQGPGRRIFQPVRDYADYVRWQGPKVVVSPDLRLIVQEYVYLAAYHWSVPTWLPNEDCGMSFTQRIDVSVLRQRKQWLPEGIEKYQEGTLAVTNVGWPEPTLESLMVQVRSLSRWIGSPFDHHLHPEPIQWRECQKLLKLSLKEGVGLALKWLERGRYIPDPAAALRERGFDV